MKKDSQDSGKLFHFSCPHWDESSAANRVFELVPGVYSEVSGFAIR